MPKVTWGKETDETDSPNAQIETIKDKVEKRKIGTRPAKRSVLKAQSLCQPKSESIDPAPEPKSRVFGLESNIATFISPYRFYKIRQAPMKMRYVEGVGKEAIPGTEKYIEFDNWKFQTSDPTDIKFMLGRQEFGVNYSMDPGDPTGYWEKRGWFKRKMVEQRIAVVPKPVNLAKEAEGNVAEILKSAGQSMATEIKRKQAQITNLRTSPGGPPGGQT